jgi:hypothetical protein
LRLQGTRQLANSLSPRSGGELADFVYKPPRPTNLFIISGVRRIDAVESLP